jgi:hypothetical protein
MNGEPMNKKRTEGVNELRRAGKKALVVSENPSTAWIACRVDRGQRTEDRGQSITGASRRK